MAKHFLNNFFSAISSTTLLLKLQKKSIKFIHRGTVQTVSKWITKESFKGTTEKKIIRICEEIAKNIAELPTEGIIERILKRVAGSIVG